MSKKEISYSEAITELEGLVEDMEQDNINIDDLSTKVKRATELIRLCRKKLGATEAEINTIFEDFDESKDLAEKGIDE